MNPQTKNFYHFKMPPKFNNKISSDDL